MKSHLALFLVILVVEFASGQDQKDTLKTMRLEEVVVKGQRLFDIQRLPPVEGTYIWSGKKTEVINVQSLNGNIAEKTPRQIFAKVFPE